MQNNAGHQVQYYQQSSEQRSERLNQSYQGPQGQDQPLGASSLPGQQSFRNNARAAGGQSRDKPGPRQGKLGAIRPGSATVAGQAGRFLANQQSKKRYEQMNQLDHVSYSYQQPLPVVNNLIPKGSQAAPQGQFAQIGTQRNSNAYGAVQQSSGMKPPFGQRKRTRPQSAARNQM